MAQAQTSNSSNTAANLITILLLIFALPVGLIVMWFWPKWQSGAKIAITVVGLILFVFIVLPFTAGIMVTTLNPQAQINKAKELQQKQQQLQQLQTPTPSAVKKTQ